MPRGRALAENWEAIIAYTFVLWERIITCSRNRRIRKDGGDFAETTRGFARLGLGGVVPEKQGQDQDKVKKE